ncbi:MAG: tetratricopeptide repeat protein [Thermodesulfobacteriota bacterium]
MGRLAPALLIAFTLAVFHPLLEADFIALDDPLYVTRNETVRAGLTVDGLGRAFSRFHECNWQPLTLASHMLDVNLFGLNPGGHHATNLILHLANTLLLYLFLTRATGGVWPSALAAALFAWHPLHVEAVAWVSSRKDVLSTFFWLLALLAYHGYQIRPGYRVYLLVMLFMILGLLAKPMLVSLPLVLLLLDYWPGGRLGADYLPGPGGGISGRSRRRWLPLLAEKVPLLALSCAAGLIAFLAQKECGAMAPLVEWDLISRAVTALNAYALYLERTFCPLDLAILYPLAESIPPSRILLSALWLAGVSGLILWAARRAPYLMVGWLWYVITLAPVSGLVQVGSQALADRYTYIPLTGLFIMAAWAGAAVVGRLKLKTAVSGALAAALLALLGLVSLAQVQQWKNSETIFRQALAATSGNYLVHNFLGLELMRLRRWAEAAFHFHEAARINKTYREPRLNAGFLFLSRGRYAESLNFYREAMDLKADDPRLHNNMGAALVGLGRYREAADHFQEALRLNPDFAEARRNLGIIEDLLKKDGVQPD